MSNPSTLIVGALSLPQVTTYLKGREFGLAKVQGHDGIGEFLGLVDHKGPAVRLPGDDRSIPVGLDLFQNNVESEGEAHGNSSASSMVGIIIRVIDFGIIGMIVIVVVHKVAFLVLCKYGMCNRVVTGASCEDKEYKKEKKRHRSFQSHNVPWRSSLAFEACVDALAWVYVPSQRPIWGEAGSESHPLLCGIQE